MYEKIFLEYCDGNLPWIIGTLFFSDYPVKAGNTEFAK